MSLQYYVIPLCCFFTALLINRNILIFHSLCNIIPRAAIGCSIHPYRMWPQTKHTTSSQLNSETHHGEDWIWQPSTVCRTCVNEEQLRSVNNDVHVFFTVTVMHKSSVGFQGLESSLLSRKQQIFTSDSNLSFDAVVLHLTNQPSVIVSLNRKF